MLLINIFPDDGAWQMTVENKWCMAIYGYNWTASVSSQIECQSVCLTSPLCVGISYSYRAGMANSCFLCKDLPPSLESNSYEFSFYRKPGKIFLLINYIHGILSRKLCNSYIPSSTCFDCRLQF